MPGDSQESALRTRARELIREGRLPAKRLRRVFGGQGSGEKCALCGEVIRPSEPEFELIIEKPAATSYLLHAGCHLAWEHECERTRP